MINLHIDFNVSNLRFKRLSKSHPKVENSRSHVAEFGHIEISDTLPLVIIRALDL